MDVLVKKRDYQEGILLFIPSILFFIISIGIFVGGTLTDVFKEQGLGAFLTSKAGILYLFAAFFLFAGVYFIILPFLPAKEEQAILMIKDEQDYNGKTITYMMFELVRQNQPSYVKSQIHCPCYTEEPNEMQSGMTYRIMVKPANHKILRVLNPNQFAAASVHETQSINNNNSGMLRPMTDKQLQEKEALLSLGTLSKYDVDMDATGLETAYLKSAGLSLPTYMEPESKKKFVLVNPSLQKQGEDVFFLADENNQMLYQFKIDFRNPLTYIVSDYNSELVALIEHKVFQGFKKYTIRIAQGKAFSVKPTLTTAVEYDIVGSDYVVMGREKGRFAPITFFTQDGRLAAELNPADEKVEVNKQKISINQSCKADMELLLLISCVGKVNSTT